MKNFVTLFAILLRNDKNYRDTIVPVGMVGSSASLLLVLMSSVAIKGYKY